VSVGVLDTGLVVDVALTMDVGSGMAAEFTTWVGIERYSRRRHIRRDVAMVITAPRGRAVIFQPLDASDGYCVAYIPQSEAVRAFVEQHRGE